MVDEDRIIKINIESEMKKSYIDYSMSVIVSRALPDVRDGLKPVHRRVLFGMNEMGNTSDKPHKKSANCVGEVMGKYHPHGDSSIYGTVVRLAQDWAMRYTLVDGHGNFGSIDGDGAAAMRYTEVRLQKMGEEMLRDIDKDTVDFVPNYDNERQEPTVLPTRFPNLLVNGSSGIAVGMATNMAPHNLSESIDACVALVDNPDLTISELMQYIKAPDFPTGGTIYGYQGVKEAFETGRGRIVIRARANIEQEGNHENIIVTEIPYNVNRAELIKYIATLVTEKKIDGIADINDESDYTGMRIVIKLRSDANSNVVLNKLYKMTQMQASFSVNNVALVNGRPRLLNLKDILLAFLEHRHEVVIRRTKYELRKAQERAHILEGLIIASKNIEEVIRIIRSSANDEESRARLAERFGLSDVQTRAILDMRLKQLQKLDQEKLQHDYDDIMAEIARLEEILNNDHVCRELIKSELIEVKEKFGDERRTDIDYTAGDFNAEDFYADDDMVITISHIGYIKRTPLSEFRAQGRGGLGSRGSDTRDEDFIEYIYTASMHSNILFFTRRGMVYKLKIYDIPEGAKNSKGRAIQNLLTIGADDAVNAVICYKQSDDPTFVDTHYLVFATRQGKVKKTSVREFARVMAAGKRAITLDEGDQLVGVIHTTDADDIILATTKGKAIRFHSSYDPEICKGLRPMGRTAAGVRGITLDGPDDAVVGMICAPEETDNDVLVVSANGFAKRSYLNKRDETDNNGYRVQSRGGLGIKTMNINETTGPLVGILSVNDSDDLMIINRSGITIRLHLRYDPDRNNQGLRVTGRATQGVRIIDLRKRGDDIASVCCVPADEEEAATEQAADDAPIE